MPVNPPNGNWYQQFMPNLNGRQINDIIFTDSLTGYAITNRLTSADTSFILKTNNGGDNWSIIWGDYPNSILSKIKFINEYTGFVGGGIIKNSLYYMLKTTNAGINWFYINAPFQSTYQADMSVLNSDTIWTVEDESLTGVVFYTSNGGASWQQQFSGGNQNPNKIYMYNARIGFMSNNSASPNIYRTTNGGQNWNINLPNENFTDMHFIDSLTGWKCWTGANIGDSCIKKTTNGGLSWVKQILPSGGIITAPVIGRFSFLNKDTIWGVGSAAFYGGGQFRGIIFRTTNSGANWLFQVPDTTIHIATYSFIQFADDKKGWAYSGRTGIHTTNGGDPVWITGIQQISAQIPKEYKLFQNYPNPFNPRTVISYQLTVSSNVKLIVYDILGKEIIKLVNQKQTSGTYQVDFSGNNLSSGVYFYQLTVSPASGISNRSGSNLYSEQLTQNYKEVRKMVLIK